MTEKTPVETANLDQYGNAALSWRRAEDLLRLQAPRTQFLGTVDVHGKPHAAPFFAIWYNGDFWFVSGPETRKSRNLAANPACTLSVRLEGMDAVLEGAATRVSDPGTLETLAAQFRDSGWPLEVIASTDGVTAPYAAPSAGPPPWNIYRFRFHTVFGYGTESPDGATRWRFDTGKA